MLLLASDQNAKDREIHPLPASNVGFTERTNATIRPPPGGRWILRIDDEPMPLGRGGWKWTPGFYAGEVTAELVVEADGRVEAEYLLDVSPDPRKLGRARFSDMLGEVLDEDPLLVFGCEPAMRLAGNELSVEDDLSVLLALARVRAHGPRLVHALHEAARQPRLVVRRRRAEEPPHRVRAVDVGSLRSFARGAGITAQEWSSFEPGNVPHRVRVDVPVAEPHADGAANRSVVALMHLVRRRVRELQERLPNLEDEASKFRTALSVRREARLALLERLDVDLARLLRSSPWKDITRPELSAAGLNALAADPLYARIHQMAWRALRVGAGKEVPEDRLWLSPTWELFERWGFVRLARMLRARFPAFSWTPLRPGAHPSGAQAGWIGSGPSATVSLLYQPAFPQWDEAAPWGFRSLSLARFPDLVIAREEAGRRSFVVVDAKYSVESWRVLRAMEAAHIYRDALRWHGVAPAAALLLLPAPGEAGWLADPELLARERVGTIVLDHEWPELLQLGSG